MAIIQIRRSGSTPDSTEVAVPPGTRAEFGTAVWEVFKTFPPLAPVSCVHLDPDGSLVFHAGHFGLIRANSSEVKYRVRAYSGLQPSSREKFLQGFKDYVEAGLKVLDEPVFSDTAVRHPGEISAPESRAPVGDLWI
jgi:hypothetical protein